MWYLKRYGLPILEPHAQGLGRAGPRACADSPQHTLRAVRRELEGHPGHVRADQQAQRPAQQAPEPG